MLTEYQETLTGSYDRFFQKGALYVGERADYGYANLGLFLPGTSDFASACENMMAAVVSKIRPGNDPVLDVGCGLGGTTEYLSRAFAGSDLYGINVSDYQIDQCRKRVPGAHFENMPAERMGFADEMFGAVVSVEAALHFKGRREFLKEALRVLKPGGEIVVADMVFNGEPTAFKKVLAGQECYSDLSQYRELWDECGFRHVIIEDITKPSWLAFAEHYKNTALHELLSKRIDTEEFNRLIRFVRKIEALPVLAYVIATARKP